VVAALGSQQPTRTKTVGAIAVEGAVVRDVYKTGVATSDKWRYALPPGYDPRRPAPLAIYLHPAAGSTIPEDRPWSHAGEKTLTAALSAAGYIVASAADGTVFGNAYSDRYANDASLANYADLYRYLRSHYSIGPVVLYGTSMGGQVGLNLLARRTIANIAAAYFICPSVDWSLETISAAPDFKAAMKFAYDATSDGQLVNALEGHNSMVRAGHEFRGVPVRMVGATGDTLTPPAVHISPFLAKVAPYAAEASELTVTGGSHLSAETYVPADLMAFLGRHITT
jgi:pimeloyl-ACP methyl ester carboxylesterase